MELKSNHVKHGQVKRKKKSANQFDLGENIAKR